MRIQDGPRRHLVHLHPLKKRDYHHIRLVRQDVVDTDEHAVACAVVGEAGAVTAWPNRPALEVVGVVGLAVVEHEVVLERTAAAGSALINRVVLLTGAGIAIANDI